MNILCIKCLTCNIDTENCSSPEYFCTDCEVKWAEKLLRDNKFDLDIKGYSNVITVTMINLSEGE